MKTIDKFKKTFSKGFFKAALATGFTLTMLSVISGTANAQTRRSMPRIQRARIEITEMGYSPERIKLKHGVPARITFIRTTDKTCGTEVVFRDYGITRKLPLNQSVVINLTPKTKGQFTFACGMDMLRGKIVVS